MKNTPAYRIRLTPDDNDTLIVTCDALPEVATFGTDRADALIHARDAIEEVIAARIDDDEDLPPFAHGRPLAKDEALVRLPTLTALKCLLYSRLRSEGVTRGELARRLGWHREQVDRLFRLDHASRMDQMDAAFAALNEDIEVSLRRRA